MTPRGPAGAGLGQQGKGRRIVKKINGLIGAVAVLGILAGCERTTIMAGQRFDTRTSLDESIPAESGIGVADSTPQVNRAVPVALGAVVNNGEWSHRGGSAARAMPHLALSAQPQRIWSASIGSGDSRRARIATAPVVAGGKIFAIDSRNQLTALAAGSGGQIWQISLAPAGESADATSGGGLAHGDGKLFAATGFGELVAINPASGGVLWRQRFDGPVTGAPAVVGNTVYVAGRDGAAWAVNAADGKLKWVQPGLRQNAGILGGLAPAIGDRRIVLPYSAGQVRALDLAKGEPVWQGAVAGQRLGRAVAYISELTGDPVIHGGRVYVGSASGRVAAFRADTGVMLWEAREGAMGPVWPVGNAVFLVSDEGRLVRLDAASGETIWAKPMGLFTRDRVKRQRDVVAHYGPVLAGGRLVVASSDGLVRFFAPDSGAELGVIEMPSGAVAAPAVAGGIMYVVTANGQVQAFR